VGGQEYETMRRRSFASLVVVLSLMFTLGSSWDGSARSSSLIKALREIDRTICRSLKATCKAKPATHTERRHNSVAAKPIRVKISNAVKVQTAPAKPNVTPPLPLQNPFVKPAEVSHAPLPKPRPQQLASAILPPVVGSPAKPHRDGPPGKVMPPLPLPKPLVKPAEVSPAPLPKPKPQQLASAILPPVVGAPAKPNRGGPPGNIDEDCLQQLRAQGAGFVVATGVVDSVATGVLDNGLCHVQNPVRLQYVKAQDHLVKLPEAPLLNCKYALQFSKWLSESAAPILAAELNTPLERVSTGPGYDCRSRNGDMFAKISEHGHGNAVDITTFSMHDGKVVIVADAQDPSSSSYTVLRKLRSSACSYFTTVLGPGTNAAHVSHFHLDLGLHGKSGTYHICE
jgi:hypothetical protein